MHTVEHNLHTIQQRMNEACQRSNRSLDEIEIITVTKYVDIPRMEEALTAGLTHFGENRIQDAKGKLEVFQDRVQWHFIGHLQTNKVREVLPYFTYIHSLDRVRLVNEIAKRAALLGVRPQCFVQVNISGEESKHGVSPDELLHLVEVIRDAGEIDMVGLMTMAPYVDNPEEIRPIFRRMKELQLDLLEKEWVNIKPKFLSMGMSNDYEIAIEEGATHIRIGSALVGT